MELVARWSGVVIDLNTEVSLGIIEEGEFEFTANRYMKDSVLNEAKKFFRKFDKSAEITCQKNGVFSMIHKSDDRFLEYKFGILDYLIKEPQGLTPQEFQEIAQGIWY